MNLKDRRIGKFFIDSTVMEMTPDVAKQTLKNMIVLKADYNFECDAIEYITISDLFENLDLGAEAPIYDMGVLDGVVIATEQFHGKTNAK